MSEIHFSAIEARYGFVLPDEYRRLSTRGLLTLNAAEPLSVYYQPGSYLWLNEMEWYSLADISDFRFQPYHLPGFVPFAFTGGGDYWCWQPEISGTSGTRVLFCPRDCEFGTVYAPNFSTALYRQILDFCRSSENDADIDAAALLRRWEADLAGPLSASWCTQLRRLAESSDRPDLAASIERADISFDGKDANVRWMLPA